MSSLSVDYSLSILALIEARLQTAIADVQPARLRDAIHHALAGGKRIRPMLVMISCAAGGGKEQQALDAAIAIELLHTSSLIHDDIMDGSSTRRGHPTVHILFDVPTAILAGDAMIALAFRSMCRIPPLQRDSVLDIFTEAFLRTCEGQGYDLEYTDRDDVELATHRLMVQNKTAKLLEASAAIGALIGGAEDRVLDLLKQYALNVGMAYQIRDDLLDAIGSEATLGKPVGQDRENNKTTFLSLVHPKRDPDRLPFSVRAEHVSAMVTEYTTAACSSLDLLPPAPAREFLKNLADSLVERVH